MKTKITLSILLIFNLFICSACEREVKEVESAPEYRYSLPANKAENIDIFTNIDIVFNEEVSVIENHSITINNESIDVEAKNKKIVLQTLLEYETSYTIIIPKGSIINEYGITYDESIELTFSTKKEIITGSGFEFVANMGSGWNLGNYFDTKSKNKTQWGNPIPTRTLINTVNSKGFKIIRIPVTWQYNMGTSPEYRIEKSFLEDVEQVVNYALDKDMYVIINVHHDEEWLIPSYDELEGAKNQLIKVWTQVADHFKDYNDHLIFETLNETRLKGSPEEWQGGTAEGRDCINQFHKVAVKAIRSSGGNNYDRYLMLSTYAASASTAAVDGLVLPDYDNLIVSIHNYFPYKFCLAEENYDINWGTEDDKKALDAEFNKLDRAFINKGIPVVLGEWGNLNHNNLEQRIVHAKYFADVCRQRGICPIWWDNGNNEQFGILNRNNNQWIFPDIADAIVGPN